MSDSVKVSVIVPAHNEETWLSGCLESIKKAAQLLAGKVEIIVVLNRCTDGTEGIARAHGAVIVREDARNLARIRNAGAAVARGEILVTIDSDSRMSRDLLQDVDWALADPKVVGGGVSVHPERTSVGIRFTMALLKLAERITGLSAGAFWCRRADFEAIGGFDTRLGYAEDVDFARRLRAHGRKSGREYVRLTSGYIETSCRKFDRFGDWHAFTFMLLHPIRMRRALRGADTRFTDEYYYDFNGRDG